MPEATHGRRRPRRRRRAPARSTTARGRAWRRPSGPTSWRRSASSSRPATQDVAETITRGDGLADLVVDHGPGLRVDDGARLLHGPGPRVPVRGAAATACSGRALVRTEPVGVVGAIVPWNVPLFITMLKLGPALAAGRDRRAEAGAGDAARRLPARRRAAEAGLPPGVVNIVPGRPRGGRAPRHPPRRRQDRLHRLHRRGQADRRVCAASS